MAFKRGDYNKAYELYSQALSIDPLNTFTNAKLYCNRALSGSKVCVRVRVCEGVLLQQLCSTVCIQLGKVQESIADCTEAIKLDNNYLRAYQRRATL